MFQYKKKKLLNSIVVDRKLPQNYSIKDKKYFSNEIKRRLPNVNYYLIKDLVITENGLPINLSKNLIKFYLVFSGLSGFILFKKIYLILNYFINIFFCRIFKKKQFLINKAIVLHDRNSVGFFHWVNDTLPKLILSKKFINKNYKIIIPKNLNNKFHKSFLKKYKKNIIILNKKNCFYKINDAILIPELSPSGNPRPKSLFDIRKEFKYLSLKKNTCNDKIYISRKFAKRRFIINESELIAFLKKENFKIYYFDKLTLEKQINLISSSRLVLSIHGAALSNIIWMKKNSSILEFKPDNDIDTNCFFSYSSILDLNYYYLICKKTKMLGSTKNSDYYVDINELKKVINIIYEKKS